MLYTRIFSRSNDWGYFPKGFHHLHPLETLRIVEKSTSTQATKTKWSFRRKKQNTKRVWNVNLKTLETWIATPKKSDISGKNDRVSTCFDHQNSPNPSATPSPAPRVPR